MPNFLRSPALSRAIVDAALLLAWKHEVRAVHAHERIARIAGKAPEALVDHMAKGLVDEDLFAGGLECSDSEAATRGFRGCQGEVHRYPHRRRRRRQQGRRG